LPQAWHQNVDLNGYSPTLDTKAKLILNLEVIERNETVKTGQQNHKNNNDKNCYKKSDKYGKSPPKKSDKYGKAHQKSQTNMVKAHQK
jgi:hypothetical protein